MNVNISDSEDSYNPTIMTVRVSAPKRSRNCPLADSPLAKQRRSDTTGPCCHHRRVSFELYSHAADPHRMLESVLAVAGTPTLGNPLRDTPQAVGDGPHSSVPCDTVSQDTLQSTMSKVATECVERQSVEDETSSTGSDSMEQCSRPDHELAVGGCSDTGCTHSALRTTEEPYEEPAKLTKRSDEDMMEGDRVTVTHIRQFNRFSVSMLDTLAEAGLNAPDRLVSYLQLMEKLLAHGSFIPVDRIPQVVSIVLGLTDSWSQIRFHSLLCQDLLLRCIEDHLLTREFLRETLLTVTHSLIRTPSHCPSVMVLHYIVGLLQSTSVTTRLSSVVISRLLDAAFSTLRVVSLGSLPSPTHEAFTLLMLVCGGDTALLARDISGRIDRLSTMEDKCRLLRSIPSLELRRQVLDIHLSQNFHSPQLSSPVTSLEGISTAHFRRSPHHHSSDAYNLCYFLRLLIMLVETHLCLTHPFPQLECLRDGITSLTGRLYEDPVWVNELCQSNVWHYLQVLIALCNQ